MDITSIIWIIVIFILSGIPLYITVKLLGGKTSIFKTAFVVLIVGLFVAAIQFYFKTWGALIAFLVSIWIYREIFRLKWWKAIVAWFLQLIVLWVLLFILALIGVSVAILPTL